MSTMTTMRRKYRAQPSEKVGYGPGLYVVQYYDTEARVWFDMGDPVPEGEARARVSRLLSAQNSNQA